MSDVSTLIINQISKSLEDLSKSGVGYIDQHDSMGILYKIDERYFDVRVTEKYLTENGTLKSK